MPKLKLTAEIVERARPTATLVELLDTDAKARGLALRITPAGVKSWSLRYRLKDGQRKRTVLGAYPAMSLSKARDRVAITLASIVEGKDPSEDKKTARATAERNKLDTLSVLAEKYFIEAPKGRHRAGKVRKKRASTLKLERYYWDRFVDPKFGKRSLHSIKRAEIQQFVDDQESISTARQIRVVFQRLFVFARWRDLIDIDPSHFVQVDDHDARDRVLTDQELVSLWKILGDDEALSRLKVTTARAIGIALCGVTLQRRGEVAGIDLSELDLAQKTWTIPAVRAKNGSAHVVPLSDEALRLIQEARLLRQWTELPENEGPLFPTSRGAIKAIDPVNLTRAFIGIAKEAKLKDARLHDLRRTGSTNITSERIGVLRFFVSRILNHNSDKGDGAAVTEVYDRNAYMREKRDALNAWSKLLMTIVNGDTRQSQ